MEEYTEALHRQAIYPVVRVRTPKTGGSGTILYSKPNQSGDVESFILTNWHVIESAIKIDKRWDPYLMRDVKEETRSLVSVEAFRYNFLSRNVGIRSSQAELMAYDEKQDMALLKLVDVAEIEAHVATLYPRGQETLRKLHIGDKVIAVGCSLGHPPIMSSGEITSMNDIIDNYEYWMSDAQTIFGNSGGAVFRQGTWEFLGIPSRIAVTLSGFQATDAITHMGYFVPVPRIYGFLESQLFQFIYDSTFSSERCAEMRDRKKQQAERAMEALRKGIIPEEELTA